MQRAGAIPLSKSLDRHGGALKSSIVEVNFRLEYRNDGISHISRGQDRPRRSEGHAIRLSHAAEGAALDASCHAQAAQRFGRTEPAAVADSSAGQLFESRRRAAGGGNRLEPWLPALRLSGNGLLGTASTVPASALRAAGPLGHGAKAQRAVEHGTQDHARCATLRS